MLGSGFGTHGFSRSFENKEWREGGADEIKIHRRRRVPVGLADSH